LPNRQKKLLIEIDNNFALPYQLTVMVTQMLVKKWPLPVSGLNCQVLGVAAVASAPAAVASLASCLVNELGGDGGGVCFVSRVCV
jgi:hypothetical protein